MDAGENEVVGRLLSDLSARLPGRVEPLEWLVELYTRATTHSAYPMLSRTSVMPWWRRRNTIGQRRFFEQLVAHEPEAMRRSAS